MRGEILGFDPDSNSGAITGHDGRRYDFLRQDWHGAGLPRRGQTVDFLAVDAATAADPAGPAVLQARQIWPVALPPPDFTWGWFLFSFRGRIPRGWFWLRWLLPVLALYFAAGLAAGLWLDEEAGSLLNGLLSLLLAWPGLAVGAKRCHDRNKNGWWQLLGAIPVIGTLWYLVDLGCLRGTAGDNRYGGDPLSGL